MSSRQAIGDKSAHARAANHILIVDDEESLAFFLKQNLLEMNPVWEIDTASTGEEAVVKINRSQYGLIIADLKMPGLNGLELLQMVNALEPNTRVILMTAYGSDKVEKEALRLNVYRYVTKPFRTEDMKQWAKDALREFEQVSPRLTKQSAKEPAEGQSRKAASGTALQTPTPAAEKAAAAFADLPRARLSAQLTRLRFLLGAQLTLLANMKGELLASAGALQGLEPARFAALVVGGFQAASAADSALGTSDTATMIVQGGQKYSAASVRVGSDGILIILFDRAAQTARWNLWPAPIRRAAEELQSLVVNAKPLSTEVGGGKGSRQELRELLYMPFPGKPERVVTPAQPRASLRKESLTLRQNPEPSAQSAEWLEEGDDFSTLSEEGISIEDARAMGLISDEVLSRLISDENEKS